jgi:ribonuclease-3
MSKGEKNGSLRARQQILANAFEAVIGSIYLERGYADADTFIKATILSKLDGILESGSWRDPKSHLQEVSQRIDNQTPVYRVLEETGPDHDKIFTLGAFVGSLLMGKGVGPSKQAAQQQAARAALEAYESRVKQIDSDVKTV